MYRYLQRKYSSRKIIVQMAGDIMLGLNKVGWEGSVFYTILQVIFVFINLCTIL